MNKVTLAQAMALGIVVAEEAARGAAAALEVRQLVTDLVTQGRDPSAEEWRLLTARMDVLSGQIQQGKRD